MNAKDTAERIRNLRKARGMSQSQFAAMCGIERGGRYGAVSTYLYIAEALNVPIETLLGGE